MSTTGDLLDQFNAARSALFTHIDQMADGVDDHRDEVWNGNFERPAFVWPGGDEGEWQYSYETSRGSKPVKKDGLVFIYVRHSSGHEGWAVFDESKIEKHEEY